MIRSRCQPLWRPARQLEMQVSKAGEQRGLDLQREPVTTLGIARWSKRWCLKRGKPGVELWKFLHSRLILLGFSKDGQRSRTVNNYLMKVEEESLYKSALGQGSDLRADSATASFVPDSLLHFLITWCSWQVYLTSQSLSFLMGEMRIALPPCYR